MRPGILPTPAELSSVTLAVGSEDSKEGWGGCHWECESNDVLFVKFSNSGDKCSMTFHFAGRCLMVGKRSGKSILVFLPSTPESGPRATGHFSKTRRKYHFMQNQAYSSSSINQLTGEQDSQKSHFVFYNFDSLKIIHVSVH